MSVKETKKNIIQAGQLAVKELIKVAKEPIVDTGEDVTADRLKNAAATKKLAIFDAEPFHECLVCPPPCSIITIGFLTSPHSVATIFLFFVIL